MLVRHFLIAGLKFSVPNSSLLPLIISPIFFDLVSAFLAICFPPLPPLCSGRLLAPFGNTAVPSPLGLRWVAEYNLDNLVAFERR